MRLFLIVKPDSDWYTATSVKVVSEKNAQTALDKSDPKGERGYYVLPLSQVVSSLKRAGIAVKFELESK